MNKFIEYFAVHGKEYVILLVQHIGLSLLSVLIAMAIAIPIGIFCSHSERLQVISERFFGVLRVIPSIAILFICIPVMGTGVKPAAFALVILAVPPVLMNTCQGFRSFSPDILEAAEAMGMSRERIFFQIKIPLAFPFIYTGVRTASVEVIASATLASYIGAGGLGNIIFTGLGLMKTEFLYIGGVSVAILSLGTGYILDSIYQYQTRYKR